jgi:hypothetical protein
LPQINSSQATSDLRFLSSIDALPAVDVGEGYVVQASIEAVEGTNAELRERATRQLLVIQESLKDAIQLTTGDRLALDTRIPLAARRT